MSQSHSNSTLWVQVRVVNVARDLKTRFKFGLSDLFFLNCKVPTTADFQGLAQVQVFNCVTTPVLPLPQSLTETQESANLCRHVFFTGRWCRNGLRGCEWQSRRAPSQPIHTKPSSRCCSARIALWHHRPGIWRWVAVGKKEHGDLSIYSHLSTLAFNSVPTKELTLRGKRMGNQENIPGECVSGFIPANKEDFKWQFNQKEKENTSSILDCRL